MTAPKLSPAYSGKRSVVFWRLVNALPPMKRAEFYTAGVLLQNMEETILQWLLAEAPPRARGDK